MRAGLVSLLLDCRLGLGALCGDDLKGFGGLAHLGGDDLSLWGGGAGPVGGERGGLGGLALVRGRAGLVGGLLLGLVLQRQQVGLLLLQPLVEPLGFALLLELPPLELLSQTVGSLGGGGQEIQFKKK